MEKKTFTQQQADSVSPRATGKSTRKPSGTRLGTLEDWRGGFNKAAKVGGRYGCSVRDGR